MILPNPQCHTTCLMRIILIEFLSFCPFCSCPFAHPPVKSQRASFSRARTHRSLSLALNALISQGRHNQRPGRLQENHHHPSLATCCLGLQALFQRLKNDKQKNIIRKNIAKRWTTEISRKLKELSRETENREKRIRMNRQQPGFQ